MKSVSISKSDLGNYRLILQHEPLCSCSGKSKSHLVLGDNLSEAERILSEALNQVRALREKAPDEVK